MKTKDDNTSLDSLRHQIDALLRKYQKAENVQALRDLGELFVSARSHFQRPDGSVDWAGRSYAYRMFVREAYERAHYGRAEMSRVQSVVRYHIGEALRRRLTPEELEEHGLSPRSPVQKHRDYRANRSATLNAIESREIHGGALLALHAAYTLLKRMDVEEYAELDERSAASATATLEEVIRTAEAHMKALAGRGR